MSKDVSLRKTLIDEACNLIDHDACVAGVAPAMGKAAGFKVAGDDVFTAIATKSDHDTTAGMLTATRERSARLDNELEIKTLTASFAERVVRIASGESPVGQRSLISSESDDDTSPAAVPA